METWGSQLDRVEEVRLVWCFVGPGTNFEQRRTQTTCKKIWVIVGHVWTSSRIEAACGRLPMLFSALGLLHFNKSQKIIRSGSFRLFFSCRFSFTSLQPWPLFCGDLSRTWLRKPLDTEPWLWSTSWPAVSAVRHLWP